MPSKHLSAETAFACDATGTMSCEQCGAEFVYEKEPGGDIFEEPKFCPECGRRNAGD
jgi:hypothetical protein